MPASIYRSLLCLSCCFTDSVFAFSAKPCWNSTRLHSFLYALFLLACPASCAGPDVPGVQLLCQFNNKNRLPLSTFVVVCSYCIHSSESITKTNSPQPPGKPARWRSSPPTTQQCKFNPSPHPPPLPLPQGTIFRLSPRNVTVQIQSDIYLSAGYH